MIDVERGGDSTGGRTENSELPHENANRWSGRDWRRAIELAHSAPKCRAKSKRSGCRCRNAAMRGKRVCRMHGGKSVPKSGQDNGNYRNGRYTLQAQDERRQLREARQSTAALIRAVKSWIG